MSFVILVRTIEFRAAIWADEPFDVAELIDDQSHRPMHTLELLDVGQLNRLVRSTIRKDPTVVG
jgi:hypothetical protein